MLGIWAPWAAQWREPQDAETLPCGPSPALRPSPWPTTPSARHLHICDCHKNLIQSVRNRRKRKGSEDDGGDSPVQGMDAPEVDTLTHFIYSVRNDRNKSDLKVVRGLH
ncbi:unnamed protein product [Nyctereutes procyonoides]|uniref:(raccoon dog) hypothetical protein n=1 Tax=Nyctereutes procyonoides TaxID=34880 RepID=A0A811YFN8_NYCPR|nr:unnamed protein product [Nyctereutes procyonoides]